MPFTNPSQSKVLSANKPITKAGQLAVKHLEQLTGHHHVAVGLSGGVDSSLSAALLIKAGWEVEGLSLWLMSGKGSCCTDGLVDAAGLCQELRIPHHIVDSRSTFQEEIVEELINGYQKGITPLPCSKCNRSVKFEPMIKWAQKNRQISRIATGHYARIQYKSETNKALPINAKSTNRNHLLRGKDHNKDQSYFLYDLPQEILGKVVFPLGNLTKTDTRKEAAEYGLRTASKPESQDLCLAEHHGSMRAFLDNYIPPRQGEIILRDGTILGEHDGIEHFTIGQRRGLGVAWKEPLHVVEIESTNNRIIVAPRSEAGKSSCIIGEVNWVSIDRPQEKIDVEVQVRYRGKPVLAELIPMESNTLGKENKSEFRCILNFQEKQFSLTPGQAAVFYFGEVLLGGGIIQKG